MNYLIFCSFEVGGLPFQIAEVLNRHGINTYYISISPTSTNHDSTAFHFGKRKETWILSDGFSTSDSPGSIIKQLKLLNEQYKFTGCLATGSKAWLLNEAGIPYYYWSFGADLDQTCFIPAWMSTYPYWKRIFKLPLFFAERKAARRTFQKAARTMIAPYQYTSLQMVCPGKELFFLPHIFSLTGFTELQTLKDKNRLQILQTLHFKRYFFSTARHTWSGYLKKHKDNKGNDIILQSFKRYLEISNDTGTALVLIEKGPDVAASKELINELNIENYVIWLKAMPRKELDRYYQGAYLCFGQMATPVLTYATIEPLVHGTPCISYFGSIATTIPYYQEPPPIYNSIDVEAIAKYIQQLNYDQDLYNKLCHASWSWVKQNCTEEIFVKKFVETIR